MTHNDTLNDEILKKQWIKTQKKWNKVFNSKKTHNIKNKSLWYYGSLIVLMISLIISVFYVFSGMDYTINRRRLVSNTADPTLEPTLEPTIDSIFQATFEPTIEPVLGPTLETTLKPAVDPTSEEKEEDNPKTGWIIGGIIGFLAIICIIWICRENQKKTGSNSSGGLLQLYILMYFDYKF